MSSEAAATTTTKRKSYFFLHFFDWVYWLLHRKHNMSRPSVIEDWRIWMREKGGKISFNGILFLNKKKRPTSHNRLLSPLLPAACYYRTTNITLESCKFVGCGQERQQERWAQILRIYNVFLLHSSSLLLHFFLQLSTLFALARCVSDLTVDRAAAAVCECWLLCN